MMGGGWRHIRRTTFYTQLMFAGFVMVWLVLLTTVRSDGNNAPPLITDVEIHSLQARWGMDLLAVPVVATVIALLRRQRTEIGDLVIALVIALAVALGMVFFPAAVMGGHIRWPLTTTYFDANGSIDYALTYAVGMSVILFVINRIAAYTSTSAADTRTTP
jgi:hypothetical protein